MKRDYFPDPTDLVVTWDGADLVLTAGDHDVDYVVELELNLGTDAVFLTPIDGSVGAAQAVLVEPTWPLMEGEVNAPRLAHGFVRVYDESGNNKGVRKVPNRLLIHDAPDESYDPSELESFLPEEVEVEAGTALASADPEVFEGVTP